MFRVHRALGPGLLESTYQTCLAHEFRCRAIEVGCEVDLRVSDERVHSISWRSCRLRGEKEDEPPHARVSNVGLNGTEITARLPITHTNSGEKKGRTPRRAA